MDCCFGFLKYRLINLTSTETERLYLVLHRVPNSATALERQRLYPLLIPHLSHSLRLCVGKHLEKYCSLVTLLVCQIPNIYLSAVVRWIRNAAFFLESAFFGGSKYGSHSANNK
eukprot:scaffold1867_cov122-Cylindrotheca_fusiformis.AAC.3